MQLNYIEYNSIEFKHFWNGHNHLLEVLNILYFGQCKMSKLQNKTNSIKVVILFGFRITELFGKFGIEYSVEYSVRSSFEPTLAYIPNQSSCYQN